MTERARRDGSLVAGQEPFLSAAVTLLDESGCTVRKWRKATTGLAYVSDDDWGIVTPEPRGAISFATLAHEVGHQMLHRRGDGRRVSSHRWMREMEAWEYALEQFDRFQLPGRDRARKVAAECMDYAIRKACRRSKRPNELAARILERIPDWVWNDLNPTQRVCSPLLAAVQRI